MKKLTLVAASLTLSAAIAPAGLSAQNNGPCYEAYVANTAYCDSDSSCQQRTVDRLYAECLRTGIVEYI